MENEYLSFEDCKRARQYGVILPKYAVGQRWYSNSEKMWIDITAIDDEGSISGTLQNGRHLVMTNKGDYRWFSNYAFKKGEQMNVDCRSLIRTLFCTARAIDSIACAIEDGKLKFDPFAHDEITAKYGNPTEDEPTRAIVDDPEGAMDTAVFMTRKGLENLHNMAGKPLVGVIENGVFRIKPTE